MVNLAASKHQIDYGGGESLSLHIPSITNRSVPATSTYISEEYMVLRENNKILVQYLEPLNLPLDHLIKFVIERGKVDKKRDGTRMGGGRRYDCGCAGQSYQPLEEQTGGPVGGKGGGNFSTTGHSWV